jgi:apolipoprotein N-acyltransferase
MTTDHATNPLFTKRIFLIGAILFSGLGWFYSTGLNGDFWWLLWIAPVPVLVISLFATARLTFLVSFIASLIGRLSWFSYLVTVATLVPAIIFTLILPLIFAFIVLLSRRTVIKTNSWLVVFAFPVFYTCFEFLLIKFSPDGTAASIGYSQMNFLPIIQIASITGILGITFIVSFIPSALAFCWYYRHQKKKLLFIGSAAVVITATIFSFGITRISNASKNNSIKVGLAVLDEKFHYLTNNPVFYKEIQTAEYYAQEIKSLASRGAQIVVLPERAININKETDSAVMHILTSVAKQNHILIITGYTNFKNNSPRNSALVISADGKLEMDYNKVHLVNRFRRTIYTWQ